MQNNSFNFNYGGRMLPYMAHSDISRKMESDQGCAFNYGGRLLPYLAHADGSGSSNTEHKYIAKIEEDGKTRYFYSREELLAYYNKDNSAKPASSASGEFSKNGSTSKNSEKASPKNSEKTSKPDEAAIQEIRKIAANSDRSLSIEERQNLGKKYGLDEKTLNIIDGNLRHPDMQGPTGQKWIDDYIRKHAKIPEAETKAADEDTTNKNSGTKQDSKSTSGTDEKTKAEEKTSSDDTSDQSSDLSTEEARTEQIASRNTGSASSSGSKPKIDASKVSAQYLMNLASNSGIDTKKLETADDAYLNAQREYNRLLNSSSSSGQERASAQRVMQKAQQEYEGELQKLVDQLNK